MEAGSNIEPIVSSHSNEQVLITDLVRQHLVRREAYMRAQMIQAANFMEQQKVCIDLRRRIERGEQLSDIEIAAMLGQDLESYRKSAGRIEGAFVTMDEQMCKAQEQLEQLEETIYQDLIDNPRSREVRDKEIKELEDTIRTRHAALEQTQSNVFTRASNFVKRVFGCVSDVFRVS